MGDFQTKFQSSLVNPKRSSLRKYQEIVIGERSFLFLLKYEVITLLFGSLRGTLGLLLRQKLYRLLLRQVGHNVVFGENITIRHPMKIIIGDNTVIDDYCLLDAKGTNNQGIKIGNNVLINRNTALSTKNGDIDIGDNTNIGSNCRIDSSGKIKLGENVLIAGYCYIMGGGHKFDRLDIPVIAQDLPVEQDVTIEDNTWLGAGVKVLNGVKIGRDSVIGAGSLVTRDIPEFSVAYGVPAKVIKKRK